ncbi:MAG TPA: PRC-barrel domain-containing protein [Actinomycetota bacterium]|nr:PRC-barrel domain-containing protein [Actinomycetota bacterium]
MTEETRRIAWLALEEGTTVVDAAGDELGRVGTVIGDEQKDIFHGITVRSSLFSEERVVPAARIQELLADRVTVDVGSDEINSLETYET